MQSSEAAITRRQRFDQFVGIYHQDMYRYAAWLSRDKAIAEDVVQEALLRAWKSLDALRDEGSAKQWLLTIVRRENARYFERKRLETVDVDNLTPSQEALLAESPDEQVDEDKSKAQRGKKCQIGNDVRGRLDGVGEEHDLPGRTNAIPIPEILRVWVSTARTPPDA